MSQSDVVAKESSEYEPSPLEEPKPLPTDSETPTDQSKEKKEKVPSFTETFDNFLILAERVLQFDTSGEMIVSTSGQSNALQTGFKRYRSIYEQTKQSPKHLQKFKEIYEKCRSRLVQLDMDDFMEWFEESSFVIAPTPKSRSKLYLTIIFRNCARIARHITDEAEKNPEKADQLYNDPAALYPEYFILYLLRIFYNVSDELDQKKLIEPKLTELEKTLGLSDDEDPVIGDGFGELMNAAGDIASELGFDIPKGGMGVNSKELRQALGQITKDGSTKDTVKDFFQGMDLKNTKDFPAVIGKVLNKMQETATQVPEPVQKSMDATAENQ
jgi:hypothetical protein